MRLADLASRFGIDAGEAGETRVTGFAIDHRKVAPGNVFGAFQGTAVNGEDFIPAAIASGAVAVVARPEVTVEGALHLADAVPRRAFARAASLYFRPTPQTVVAVTGTNGKTSCVEMTRQIWRMCGERAASIGTLGVTTPDESVSTGLTTPDIVTFLSNMTGLAREGVTHVAYEASSHGLSQYRNEGLPVKAGAFTNLSRDHLDYHKDMEDYFAAKMRLFTEVVDDGGTAVVWADDAWSDRVIAVAKERGLKYIAITDHSKRVTMANGLDAERLRAHWKEIDKVRKEVSGIEILCGIECDILEDATLDLPDDVLVEADWVIAVLHYGLKQPREQIMKRLMTAVKNPHVSIIGHPSGRIVGKRPGADIDFGELFKAAADHEVLMEINAHPSRLDLDGIQTRAAKEHGIPIVISTDAHSTSGLDVMQYGVYQARRAGLEKKDVANTRTFKSFAKLLRRS